MALILSGDTGVPASGMPTGSVIQTVTSNFLGNFSQATSGSTYYATGHSASITPISSTSKILVTVTGFVSSNSAGSWGAFTTIYRGATNLATLIGGSGNQGFGSLYSSTTSNLSTMVSMQYLDSPSTTSPTTYQVYIGGGGSTVQWASTSGYNNNTPAVITLLEIHG